MRQKNVPSRIFALPQLVCLTCSVAVFLFLSPFSTRSAAAEPVNPPAAQSVPNSTTSPAPDPDAPEVRFPYVIKVRSWSDDDFRSGDKLTIASVRSNRKKLEAGGTYLVQGAYTLSSAAVGRILLTHAAPGPVKTEKEQRYEVERGSGTFSLIATKLNNETFHVTFYFPENPNTTDQSRIRFAHGSVSFK